MKKLLAMLLCILMVVSLVSCGGDTNVSKDNSTNTESGDTSETTSESGPTLYKATIPEDFSWEGDFVILSTAADPSSVKYTEFGFNSSEEMEENVLNDAVITRNDIVETLLGVKIVEEMEACNNRSETGEFVSFVETAINSGTAFSSAACTASTDCSS